MRQLSRFFMVICCMAIAHQMYAQQPASSSKEMPVERKTGDPLADEKAHIAAKNQWIKENPEAYRAMGGDPEDALRKPPTDLSAKYEKPALPAFKAVRHFVLKDVVAVPAKGMSADPSEIARTTQSIQQEFPVGKTQLQFLDAQNFRIYLEGKLDLRGIQTAKIGYTEWFFPNTTCETCSKTLRMEQSVTTSGGFIYVMENEDEGSPVAFKFTFEPSTK